MKEGSTRVAKFLMSVIVVIATFLMAFGITDVKAAGYAVTINKCAVSGTNVVVTAQSGAVPSSDDGTYYLMAQEVYDSGASGRQVATAGAGANAQFVFALGKNTGNSNLYSKFVVAVKKGGVMQQVSAPQYITNPEVTATHTAARSNPGKKGILPAATMFDTADLKNLGVHQCTYNLPIGDLCKAGDSITYQYNGKTYKFNKAIVGQYDSLVPKLNSQGIQLSIVILDNMTSDQTLIHPLSRNHAGANYYAFNTAEKAGVEKLEAIASFLGERYSGTGHGTVDNWIIGNEVNARSDWHYMSAVDITTFANAYADAIRIFYNGLRSENANARIYISVDQQWGKASNAALYYGSRDFLNTFNSIVSSQGNIDWHVAVHPYNVPLYDPVAWSTSSRVKHSQDTAYITMQNIDVLTDFLCQSSFISPTGQVRSVICSEVGYTSSQGEAIQAASITYGYLQAVANQHIDGFILSRELDDNGEIAQGLALGLVRTNGAHKAAYDYYKNIDTANAATYTAAAAGTIGVTDMAQLLTVR